MATGVEGITLVAIEVEVIALEAIEEGEDYSLEESVALSS